ncbi:MAG: DUF1570 domain-containing protein [Planctomycetota bacterium]
MARFNSLIRPTRRTWGVGFPVVGAAWLLIAGCTTLSSPPPIASSTEDWSFEGADGSRITSEHYVLHTTCTSAPLLRAMPGFLETCWHEYTQLVPCEMPPDRPMETYLFKARWQWDRFTDRFSPQRAATYKRIRSGGYSERGITVSHYSSRRGTLAVLAHEGLHQYLELTRGERIPAWINEGLATRFEAFELDRNNLPVFKPEMNFLRRNNLREALTSGSLLPMEDILGTNAGIELHKTTADVRTYYAQAWSLVMYLLQPPSANPYSEGFRRLLQDVGTETMLRNARAYLATDTDGTMTPGEAVFRAYVCDDLAAFQADYEAFVQKLLDMRAS